MTTKFPRRTFLQVATGGALASSSRQILSRQAFAQTYPSRPVRLIVAFVPGGATDTLARQISEDLKQALGEAVVIENRPGAGGYIAWSHVASSEPDGHTLLLAENALGMSQALYRGKTSSFDPLKQYDAVAGVATSPSALIVATQIPANTVAELVAYSKTVKGKMNYASAGVGSVSHLNFEVFKDAVGMEAVHIPYKGGGAAIADIVAGHVPMTITSVQGTKSLVEAGKLKALAVTSLDALARHAARSDHAGSRREEHGRRRAALLVRHLRPEGPAGPGEGQARRRVLESAGRPEAARAARQSRHHAGILGRPRAARAARKRDQELEQVRRREGHQAGIARRDEMVRAAPGETMLVVAYPRSCRCAIM